MILADLHSHTDFSGDCQTTAEDMLAKAKEIGLKYYAITDHHDLDFPKYDISFTVDIQSYTAALQSLKAENSNDFKLLAGIEFGLQPHLNDELLAIDNTEFFDIIIGSCHLADGQDPYQKVFFEGKSRDEAYRQYFEATLKSVQALDGFDVLGHLDYAIRYWPGAGPRQYDYSLFADVLDAILETLIRKEIALEVNSAGYPYKLNQPHPSYEVLTRYHELGGRLLTIGSDAHITKNIASHFDIIEERLKAIGFEAYTVFINRKPKQIGF